MRRAGVGRHGDTDVLILRRNQRREVGDDAREQAAQVAARMKELARAA